MSGPRIRPIEMPICPPPSMVFHPITAPPPIEINYLNRSFNPFEVRPINDNVDKIIVNEDFGHPDPIGSHWDVIQLGKGLNGERTLLGKFRIGDSTL